MGTFALPEHFIEQYRNIEPSFGYKDAGGNSLGEITFIRTYSRLKEDGTKEKWYEVCERVINGMYSIQKDWCKSQRLPWNDRKGQASAQEAYDRLFKFKWTPPGRGLWMMGTDFIERFGSAALQNCAFVSSANIDTSDPGYIFSWAMEALMLGIGVGWDTEARHKGLIVHKPQPEIHEIVIEDSREGWIESLRLLINSYLKQNQNQIKFDYSSIRKKGSPINGFGGISSGAEPLMAMHNKLIEIFDSEVGNKFGTRLIADTFNLLAKCVVSANVRKGAEVGIGELDDYDFINLKNASVFPDRNEFKNQKGWSFLSNNSIKVDVGENYSSIIDNIATNGEPGVIWLDVTRKYGRLIDAPNDKDHRVMGFNPCLEQPLESFECCTLVETHINRAESKEDFLRTQKFAYLYAKSVTLLPTHWAETNAIMQRNRRIGSSITSISSFVDKNGLFAFRDWADTGYNVVERYDEVYSEWLGVRPSIKKTTCKPSGTVSILSGAKPGTHWLPGGEYHLRSLRFADNDPALELYKKAGYHIEDSVYEKNTKIMYLPIHCPGERSEKEVSIFEKIHLASEVQKYWSDNGVSATISFDKKTEGKYIETVLNMYEGQLKAISFLPMDNNTYPQMPYQEITKDQYDGYISKLKRVNFSKLYKNGVEAQGEKYCSNDVCTV